MRRSCVVATLIAAVTVAGALPLAAVRTVVPAGTRVQTYARGLAFPVDMAWVKGTNKLFFTEKDSGKVRVMVGRRLLARPCVNLDVNSSGERGALGIALHPDYDDNHHLYVYFTKARPLENRVTRFTVRRNRCRNATAIVRGLSASSSGYHNGGQIEFVGRRLFVSTGDAHDPANAQTVTNRLGKVLRLRPGGGAPGGNPFGNAVWSYGLRNPFGLTRRPGTRALYLTDNGPNCDDELNRIRRGRNYGWGPGYACGGGGVGVEPKRPLVRWGDIVVPTDPLWYRGRMRSLNGDLYVGDFRYGRLHRIVVNRRGTRVRQDRIIYDGDAGIVDVAKGPGGWLYFLTPAAIRRIVPERRL